jgi:hypothetical protein
MFVLQGCATGLNVRDSQQFQENYYSGNYQGAADLVESELGLIDQGENIRLPVVPTKSDAVLLHLDAAETLRLTGDIQRSIQHYDATETLFKSKDTESLGSSLLGFYDPTPAEKVLVNFYKALSFWSQGEYGYARVEFNRANERTRLAVERYEKQLQDALEDANNATRENNLSPINFSAFVDNPEISGPISQWEVYDSFVNPTVAFTNALFLASQDGPASDDARVYMNRVREMVGDDSQAHPAFNYADLGENQIWILAETGLGPILNERKVDLPVPYKGDVLILSMAFPNVSERSNSVSLGQYRINDSQLQFAELANMDKLVRTEFSKRWPAIVTSEVVSALIMMAIQREAGKKNEDLGVFAKLLTVASNQADTRIWTLTPQQWSVAKIKAPDQPTLAINYGSDTLEVPIQKGSAMVYIKQPTSRAQPVVKVLPLTKASAL